MKYKFRLSETNHIEFTQKELDKYGNVTFLNDDMDKGKIIPITRFDGKTFAIVVPIELIETEQEE